MANANLKIMDRTDAATEWVMSSYIKVVELVYAVPAATNGFGKSVVDRVVGTADKVGVRTDGTTVAITAGLVAAVIVLVVLRKLWRRISQVARASAHLVAVGVEYSLLAIIALCVPLMVVVLPIHLTNMLITGLHL